MLKIYIAVNFGADPVAENGIITVQSSLKEAKAIVEMRWDGEGHWLGDSPIYNPNNNKQLIRIYRRIIDSAS